MKVYFKDASGQKIEIEVTDEVAKTMQECRREEWRNEAKERYYRGRTLSTLTDDAIEFRQEKQERSLMVESPEEKLIAEEERNVLRVELNKRLETLTKRQRQVLNLLCKGLTITEIAKQLNVTKQSVNDIRKAIQNKFEDFLK
jgi:DNA-binding NarL/FixJ family response regulator